MSKPDQPIAWPAIIKYAGQAELAFVESQAEWNGDAFLHGYRYLNGDTLIDSNGAIYALSIAANGKAQPTPTGKSARLEDVIELVKGHAAQMGSCCVSKFTAPTIREAVSAARTPD